MAINASLLTASGINATGSSNTFGVGQMVTVATVFVVVSSVTGTTPSATFSLDVSPDGTNWLSVATGAAMTAAGIQRLTATHLGAHMRVSYTVSGTTPVFTTTITLDAR